MGDKLIGAKVSHNHPIAETSHTFSTDDLELFIKYNLESLRGCDKKYTYEFSRKSLIVDEPPSDWMNFESYERSRIIELSKEYGVGYRRWKND